MDDKCDVIYFDQEYPFLAKLKFKVPHEDWLLSVPHFQQSTSRKIRDVCVTMMDGLRPGY